MINIDFNHESEILEAFPTEQSAIEHFEAIRWRGNPTSPFDPYSKVYVCKGNKYKCKNTGKYFNVKTNTVFHGSRIPLRTWFCAIYLFHQEKLSSYKLGERLGVTQKTAWYMFKRISYCEDWIWFKEHEVDAIIEKALNSEMVLS